MNYLCPKPLDSFLVDPNNYYSMHMSKTIHPIWIIMKNMVQMYVIPSKSNWQLRHFASTKPVAPMPSCHTFRCLGCRGEVWQIFTKHESTFTPMPSCHTFRCLGCRGEVWKVFTKHESTFTPTITRLLSAEVWNIIHFLIRGVIKLFLIYCEYPNTLFECLGECMYIMYYSFNTKLLKSFKEIFSDYR